jgi:hypothetical protein
MKKRPTTLSVALARRCIAEGIHLERPDAMYIERTYAGYWQRAQGAWSWELCGPESMGMMIGSQWPAREVLRWEDWQPDGGAIYPGPITAERLRGAQASSRAGDSDA